MHHDHLAAPNRALTWLRVIVWIVPSALVPSVAILIPANLHFPKSTGPYLWAASLLAVVALGYYDARLFAQQRRMSPDDARRPIMRRVIVFCLAQIVIVPVVCYILVLLLVLWIAVHQ